MYPFSFKNATLSLRIFGPSVHTCPKKTADRKLNFSKTLFSIGPEWKFLKCYFRVDGENGTF